MAMKKDEDKERWRIKKDGGSRRMEDKEGWRIKKDEG